MMDTNNSKDSLRSYHVLGSLSEYQEGLALLRSKEVSTSPTRDRQADEVPDFIQIALESCPSAEIDLLAAYKQLKNDR